MRIRALRHLVFAPAFALVGLLLPGAASGIDGVVEIDEARALAGGITPADGPARTPPC